MALTLGSALALSMPAFAADIVEEQPYDWSGVYVGIFAGVGHTSSDWDGLDDDILVDPVAIDESLNETTFLLGALAGINFQHDRWVFGLEADIAWFDSKEHERLDGAEGLDITSEIDLLGSLRARAGYAADRTLFYVTGGLAFADAEHTWDDDGTVAATNLAPESLDLDFGWVVGAGIEHAWTDNWLVRLEGFYFDLGSEDGEAVAEQIEADTFEVDQEIWVGRIGISYKFN
ncbi:outer membrane protein [Taklimakanibacter lacteus]|uniref:outer membrane protein n=1 Tax=Taklimakanibacter lacteus TaxID=2268456 RepID=UPI0013C42CED